MKPRRERDATVFFLCLAAACGKSTGIPSPGCDPNATAWTVWVTNQASGIDTVTVLKPTMAAEPAASTLATIKVGRAPHNIAFGPDGRFAYVANLDATADAGTVSVIDATTYQVVATVGAGRKPHGLAPTPDGRYVWVANEKSDDLTVIDTATNQTVPPTIRVGDGPLLVAFTPDGKKAYVSNGDEGTTSVVDVASRQVTKTITTGLGAMGLVVRQDGRYVFETEGRDNRMSIIDTSTDTVAAVLTADAGMVEAHGVALAGGEVLVTNRTGQSLAFVDAQTFAVKASLAIQGRPDIIAVSPNCERAYFALRDRPAVAVVDIPGRRYVGTIDLDAGDTHGIAVRREP